MNFWYRSCPAGHYPYTVQRGDTLYYIANRLEVRLEDIISANPGIDPYHLMVGQMICIPACPPHFTPKIIEPGDTLYQIAQTWQVSVESILQANPGIDPNYLRVGQRICIPTLGPPGQSDQQTIQNAMQHDIDLLKEESSTQQTMESNYGNSTDRTRVLKVTGQELQFDVVPVIFQADYRGHYTAGESYPYYTDAAMGGQRGIVVKDDFGIWHSFGYRVPI